MKMLARTTTAGALRHREAGTARDRLAARSRQAASILGRFGLALLIFAVAVACLRIPAVAQGPGTLILVAFFAVLAAAWGGGLGPGLLVTALFVLTTWPSSLPAWRLVRLALFIAGGAGISLMVGTLRDARRRAEQASRAKDLFLAMISHELRTPLTPPLLAASALLDDPALPAALRGPLEDIRRGLVLEARLVDDLLDAMRAARGGLRLECRPIDAHDAVRRAIDACAEGLRAGGLQLRTELTAAEHWVEGDPARLQQVVWNLLRNAAQHGAAGGAVAVGSRNEPDPAGGAARPRLVVEVTDSGPGIPPGQRERVFRPFARSPDGTGGLGLGLAIGRALAEAHGGGLTAHGAGPGGGATFRLVLPTTAAAPAAPGWAAPPEDGPWPGRILLVEDDEPTRRILARLLRRRGSAVLTAATVAEARALARAGAFDIIVSDLGLPDGSGTELIAGLAGERPVRAIALSGYGTDEDARRCRAAGFATHLTKPVDVARLEGAIRQVMAGGDEESSPAGPP